MTFFIGLLTFVLVVNCVLLILLVLVQLPKKDAGAGMAFGAGTADALFGAGSGNALTKITKYATIVFLALALGLGRLQSWAHSSDNGDAFKQQVSTVVQSQTAPAANHLQQGFQTTSLQAVSNAPAAPVTPVAPAAGK